MNINLKSVLFFIGILITLNTPFHVLFSDDNSLLKSNDVKKIMQQILDHHLEKKEVSSFVLKQSLKIYFDQFDPNKIYLLDSEVKKNLEISPKEMEKLAEQYQHQDFTVYHQINDVIQRAILRARKIRKEFEANPRPLFEKAKAEIMEKTPPATYKNFASNEEELKKRIHDNMVQFIVAQIRRFGPGVVFNKKSAVIAQYNKDRVESEDDYLFVKENNEVFTDEEKEHYLTLHILKSLASSLDAHTTFFDSIEANDIRMNLEKEFDGVGIIVQEILDEFVITHILAGSPAEKSGKVKVNDRLIEIDDKKLTNATLSHVLDLLRGKNGTSVKLVLNRPNPNLPNGETISLSLNREPIAVVKDRVDVSSEAFGSGIIGKISLHGFYENNMGISSEKDMREAIKELDKQGNLRGLILDLRENTGGFLMQAVKVAGLFIKSGVIVVSKYSSGDEHFYRDIDPGVAFKGPLIVLTSHITASAAEIVAQALQDYGVAIVVGDEHTYGKGSIQTQTVTDKGKSSFKVTVGKYYTVSGKTPQIKGVIADIVVPGPYMFQNLGERYLNNPLVNDTINSIYNDQLSDVEARSKSWYTKFYIPTLQSRQENWVPFLPILKKNSAHRIAQNKNYQFFLKKIKGEPIVEEEEEEIISLNKGNKNFGKEDLQMVEAVNILKDMIMLQSQNNTISNGE